jgi:hypothetical protein
MPSVMKIPQELARELDRLPEAEHKPRAAFVVELLRQDVDFSLRGICWLAVPSMSPKCMRVFRPGEEIKTDAFLKNLEYLPVTPLIARQAGLLRRNWRTKGQTLSFTDVTIATVA